MKAKEIAAQLSKNLYTIRNLLSRLVDEGKITLTKYTYTLIRSERSERSEVLGTPPPHDAKEATEPHYDSPKPHYGNDKPHYGEDDTVVRFESDVNAPVESDDGTPENKPHYAHYAYYGNCDITPETSTN